MESRLPSEIVQSTEDYVMNVVITARNKQKQNMDYTELSSHGLSATVDVSGGIGSPDQRYRAALIQHRGKFDQSGFWAVV
jgi:hypothetical protein